VVNTTFARRLGVLGLLLTLAGGAHAQDESKKLCPKKLMAEERDRYRPTARPAKRMTPGCATPNVRQASRALAWYAGPPVGGFP
jgi:hypothetical protein